MKLRLALRFVIITALPTTGAVTALAQQLTLPTAPAMVNLPATAQQAANTVSTERIAEYTRFLSDDLLEGRGPGTRGGQLAALYLADQFALLGLQPLGDPGPDGKPTWFQHIPMVNVAARPESTLSFTTHGQTLSLQGGADFTATSQTAQPTVDIASAPVVFVGFGIHAPEFGWDDYAGTDVRGKVVLILVGQPPAPEPSATGLPKTPFTGKPLTYYGRWTYKYEEAARHGAAGAILIHQTQMASYPWTVLSTRWGHRISSLRDSAQPREPFAGWMQLEPATRLLAANGLAWDRLLVQARTPGFRAIPLNSTASAHLLSTVEPFTGVNVLGRLPAPTASGPALLYTAHFDTFGLDPANKQDPVFNGAIDNATGCGMLLETARAFRAVPAPSHPVLFAAVDGEEQGLLGSEFLAEHPPVPARDIALNLNYEGIFIMPAGIPEELLVTGAERTSFLPDVRQTATAYGMTIVPDPLPTAGYFYRSDHFSLARAGVPAFSIGAGNKFQGHDLQYGQAIAADYIAHHYHQPSDELRPGMDLRAYARMTQLAVTLGWEALLSPNPITWNPGDEFAPARTRSQQP